MDFVETERVLRGGITIDQLRLPFYRVSLKDNKLNVTVPREDDDLIESAIAPSLRGDKFNLVTEDRGEFGGGVYAVSPQGRSITLSTQNARGFFQSGQRHFVLTGLGKAGAIYEIHDLDAMPSLALITTLKGAPRGIAIEDNRVYVLTVEDFEMVEFREPGVRTTVLIERGPWDRVPVNMVKRGNEFAIGMHAGVVVVQLVGSSNQAALARHYAKRGPPPVLRPGQSITGIKD